MDTLDDESSGGDYYPEDVIHDACGMLRRAKAMPPIVLLAARHGDQSAYALIDQHVDQANTALANAESLPQAFIAIALRGRKPSQ